MLTDKRPLARELYYQTELTKTQIANILNISRRSLHYWIKEGNWDRLKESAEHLPSLLAEKTYHLYGQTIDSYLSERRVTNPLNNKEAQTLYKLVLCIQKLKNRSAINESMEMMGIFQDRVKKQNPKLAEDILPFIEDYLSSRASIYQPHLQPETFTKMNRMPFDKEVNYEEQALDQKDFFDWEMEQNISGDTSYQFPEPLGADQHLPAEIAAEPHPDNIGADLCLPAENATEPQSADIGAIPCDCPAGNTIDTRYHDERSNSNIFNPENNDDFPLTDDDKILADYPSSDWSDSHLPAMQKMCNSAQ